MIIFIWNNKDVIGIRDDIYLKWKIKLTIIRRGWVLNILININKLMDCKQSAILTEEQLDGGEKRGVIYP